MVMPPAWLQPAPTYGQPGPMILSGPMVPSFRPTIVAPPRRLQQPQWDKTVHDFEDIVVGPPVDRPQRPYYREQPPLPMPQQLQQQQQPPEVEVRAFEDVAVPQPARRITDVERIAPPTLALSLPEEIMAPQAPQRVYPSYAEFKDAPALQALRPVQFAVRSVVQAAQAVTAAPAAIVRAAVPAVQQPLPWPLPPPLPQPVPTALTTVASPVVLQSQLVQTRGPARPPPVPQAQMMGKGAQRCSYYPPPACASDATLDAQYRNKNFIGLTNANVKSEGEQLTFAAIRRIPNYRNYFIVPETAVCENADFTLQRSDWTNNCASGFDKPMQYMPYGGKPLSEAPLTFAQTAKVVRHLIQGLLLLHEYKVVHNDIHSHNIVVDSATIARFIDWDKASSQYEPEVLRRTVRNDYSGLANVVFNKFAQLGHMPSRKSPLFASVEYLVSLMSDIPMYKATLFAILDDLERGQPYGAVPPYKVIGRWGTFQKSTAVMFQGPLPCLENKAPIPVTADTVTLVAFTLSPGEKTSYDKIRANIPNYSSYYIMPDVSRSCQSVDTTLIRSREFGRFGYNIHRADVDLLRSFGREATAYYLDFNANPVTRFYRITHLIGSDVPRTIPTYLQTIRIMKQWIEGLYALFQQDLYLETLNSGYPDKPVLVIDDALNGKFFLWDIRVEDEDTSGQYENATDLQFFITAILQNNKYDIRLSGGARTQRDQDWTLLLGLIPELVQNIAKIRVLLNQLEKEASSAAPSATITAAPSSVVIASPATAPAVVNLGGRAAAGAHVAPTSLSSWQALKTWWFRPW